VRRLLAQLLGKARRSDAQIIHAARSASAVKGARNRQERHRQAVLEKAREMRFQMGMEWKL
jgi:hypothetical protein